MVRWSRKAVFSCKLLFINHLRIEKPLAHPPKNPGVTPSFPPSPSSTVQPGSAVGYTRETPSPRVSRPLIGPVPGLFHFTHLAGEVHALPRQSHPQQRPGTNPGTTQVATRSISPPWQRSHPGPGWPCPYTRPMQRQHALNLLQEACALRHLALKTHKNLFQSLSGAG